MRFPRIRSAIFGSIIQYDDDPRPDSPHKIRLILMGYWSGKQVRGWPDPQNFVDASWDVEERLAVVRYLSGAPVPWVQMGYSNCRFCDQVNGCGELTDGVYLWPDGLAHYLLQHDVRLPQRFVEHVNNAPFPTPPEDLEPAWHGRIWHGDVDEQWWRAQTGWR